MRHVAFSLSVWLGFLSSSHPTFAEVNYRGSTLDPSNPVLAVNVQGNGPTPNLGVSVTNGSLVSVEVFDAALGRYVRGPCQSPDGALTMCRFEVRRSYATSVVPRISLTPIRPTVPIVWGGCIRTPAPSQVCSVDLAHPFDPNRERRVSLRVIHPDPDPSLLVVVRNTASGAIPSLTATVRNGTLLRTEVLNPASNRYVVGPCRPPNGVSATCRFTVRRNASALPVPQVTLRPASTTAQTQLEWGGCLRAPAGSRDCTVNLTSVTARTQVTGVGLQVSRSTTSTGTPGLVMTPSPTPAPQGLGCIPGRPIVDWLAHESVPAVTARLTAMEGSTTVPSANAETLARTSSSSGPWTWSYTNQEARPVECVWVLAPVDEEVSFRMGQDYSGNLTSNGDVSLSFTGSGVYQVLLVRADPQAPSRYSGEWHLLAAGSGALGRECAVHFPGSGFFYKAGDPAPAAGAAVFVATGDGRFWGDPVNDIATLFTAPVRGNTVAAAITAVHRAYEANRRSPVQVWLVGHGAPGQVTFGEIQNPAGGTFWEGLSNLGITAGGTKRFADAVRGEVSEINFIACCVSAETPEPHMMQYLADSLDAPVSGWNQYLMPTDPIPFRRTRLLVWRPLFANAIYKTATPR
jgi:hypothetical protein